MSQSPFDSLRSLRTSQSSSAEFRVPSAECRIKEITNVGAKRLPSFLPNNQSPLLRSMLDVEKINAQRSTSNSQRPMFDYDQDYDYEQDHIPITNQLISNIPFSLQLNPIEVGPFRSRGGIRIRIEYGGSCHVGV